MRYETRETKKTNNFLDIWYKTLKVDIVFASYATDTHVFSEIGTIKQFHPTSSGEEQFRIHRYWFYCSETIKLYV